MNCREAQNELITPRDTPLGAAGSSALEEHLAGCAECRALQQHLLAAATAWRETDAQVKVPSAATEWHAVRRRLRTAGDKSVSRAYGRWQRALQIVAPLTAVAALSFVVWNGRPVTSPETLDPAIPATIPAIASTATPEALPEDPWAEFADHFAYASKVEYVETENEDASPFVYVDDESGWLIVWASAPPANASI